MAQVLKASFAEYLCTFVYKIFNQTVVNTIYFGARNNVGASEAADELTGIAQHIADKYAPLFKNNLVSEHRYEGLYLTMVRGRFILPAGHWSTTQAGPGTLAGAPCPAGVCVNIHYKAPYKGKTFRRYIAFPGLTDADIGDDGKITLAKRNQLNPIAEALLDEIPLAFVDETLNYSLFVLGQKFATLPATGTKEYAFPTKSSISPDTSYRRSRRLRSDAGNLPV